MSVNLICFQESVLKALLNPSLSARQPQPEEETPSGDWPQWTAQAARGNAGERFPHVCRWGPGCLLVATAGAPTRALQSEPRALETSGWGTQSRSHRI